MRLIDADELREQCDDPFWCVWLGDIDNAPTIEAVPVDDLHEKLNEAHNEGYDVGYWAGRRDYEPKWIPVTERLPEEWRPVLGLIQFCDEEEPPAQQVLWYLGNGHWRETWRGDMIESAVTHWMPLPEAPKGERKDDESHPFADDVMMGEWKDDGDNH